MFNVILYGLGGYEYIIFKLLRLVKKKFSKKKNCERKWRCFEIFKNILMLKMESSKFINYLKNMCGGYLYIMIYQIELEIHFNEMFLCFYFPFSFIILHK
jgi:hypothetical protein